MASANLVAPLVVVHTTIINAINSAHCLFHVKLGDSWPFPTLLPHDSHIVLAIKQCTLPGQHPSF